MMALYAEVEKLSEDGRYARYGFTDVEGVQRTLLLDKETETISLESGPETILFRAVARKVATAWLNGLTPDRMIVQS